MSNKPKSFFFPREKETICALATPPGEGALSLIRLSGPASFKIARKLCPFLPAKIKSHRVYFGRVLHPQTRKVLDESLVTCFEKGRSFTGEESMEFSCHGGSFMAQNVLSALSVAGAKTAQRGEFSYRAFMNGKMDLIQAESILSLIKSRSPAGHAQALSALRGGLSKKLKVLEQKLLRLLSHIEASLDFSEEDISPFSAKEQEKALKEIKLDLAHLLKGFEQGLINREGFSILLLGAPNAGKSSLFNYLLGEDKAIVTKQAGTTRDILSASLLWQGREFTLKDSAGLRSNPDPIEKEGIKKAQEEMKKANLLLFLVESQWPLNPESFFGLETISKTGFEQGKGATFGGFSTSKVDVKLEKANQTSIDKQKLLLCFSKADLLPSKKQRDKFLNPLLNYLNQTDRKPASFEKGATLEDSSSYQQDLKRENSNKISIKQKNIQGTAFEGFSTSKEKPKPSNKTSIGALWLSTHTGEGIEQLKDLCFKRSEKEHGESFLSTPRQGQALKHISYFMKKAEQLLKQKGSPDLVAFELREGLSHLQQLTGQQYNEEVIKGIFKEFCLGK